VQIDYDFNLTGKTAVITGGASGIGSAIARAFVAKGVKVALLDLNLDGAKAMASGLGEHILAFRCDVSNSSSVAQAVADAHSGLGDIDILVNSAGIVALAPAESLSDQDWQRTLDINLTGTFYMSREVGKIMLKS